ncbi:single-stranded DNA-binding protein [Williamsoniiplasma lucivorax]|uniref:Single-stranded DNA-binding protein n=1 Tax=Williamsoniiplasma lucivorax TaxID=209274 RepID=A0A2S5RDJ5_9MOLU|nr:single-stranded DNA-binding protein [Williamsoniiplasma lucivorax]PPE05391.1 single-strand DNA-binding protein [Williamsoniiplasma lucivorax]
MNQINLIGRITKDLEQKQSSNGEILIHFTIAVDEWSKEGNKTNFIPCVAFKHQAENMLKYLRKGSLIGVEGHLSVKGYEKEGKFLTFINVVADRVMFLESKKDVSNNQEQTIIQHNSSYVDNNSDNNSELIEDSILWD